jgi:hypothetical protein
MKRALLLLGISVLCAVGYLYVWGFLPFIPAISSDIADEIRSAGLPIIVLTYATIVVLAIIFYAGDIIAAFRRSYGDTVAPIIEDNHRVSLVLSHRFEGTEQALENFADALQQYARHLESHTDAIKGLSEASQALKSSAVEQNQILDRLSHTLGSEKLITELSRVERVVSDLEKRTQLVLQARDELEGKKSEAELPPPAEIPPVVARQSPPGCLGNPRALYKKVHGFAQ